MPSAPLTRGPYAKTAARREEILRSALIVFAEKGFDGTSLTAIGEAVGVTREALRHYFSSRQELLLALVEARDTRSKDLISDIPHDEPVMRRVEASAERQRSDKGLVSLYTSLVATALHSGDASKRFFTDRFAALRAGVARAVELDQERGLIRADIPAQKLAALILAVSDGLQQQWLLDESIDVADGLRILETLLTPPA